MTTRIFCTALAAATTISATSGTHAQSGSLPPALDHYLSEVVKLTSAQQRDLVGGAPVTKLLPADESKEVAVFGAIWINAPIQRFVEAMKDIENFERGAAFRVTKRISTPPALADFAALRLPDKDLREIPNCRLGDCVIKVSEQGLRRFRDEVDWRGPDPSAQANQVMRQLSLEYVNAYLAEGNTRLAVYRDNSRPTSVASEFREMTDQMPELTDYLPELRDYLLNFPRVALLDVTSFLYWQETDFGLRPTIRISHVTIREKPNDTVVASKMIYASHYFWTGIELRVLLPDPRRGPGFWLVTVSRSRSDGLSGFTGWFVRRRARSEVERGVLAGLRITKERMEVRR